METNFNTSFIPKKSMQIGHGGGSGSQFVQRRSVYGPGFFMSATLFTISIMVSLGIFAYSEITKKNVEEKISIIVKARDGLLSEKDISEFEDMDKRLATTRAILSGHVAVSELLYTLEDITYANVQYTDVLYGLAQSGAGRRSTQSTQNETDGSKPLTIKGLVPDFATVAVQNDQLLKHEAMLHPTVTELEQEKDSDAITFSIDAMVKPSLVRFGSAIERVGTPQPIENNDVTSVPEIPLPSSQNADATTTTGFVE